MKYKIDLHTHSIMSYDGGITDAQYVALIGKKTLDYIAITDHNETGFAIEMKKKFGQKIIVGEEISTIGGEVIGLFLRETIQPNLSVSETVTLIHAQGGVVYIPHPFEVFRKGLQNTSMFEVKDNIDIVEVFNARARWRGKSLDAFNFAKKYGKAMSAASDAHCALGIGSAYCEISEMPTSKSLPDLLRKCSMRKKYAIPISYICPAFNKIKHRAHAIYQLTHFRRKRV